ncbi:GntR family transcriptional regulator [Dolosigranulum savutiense]|uniref:GntR family transcriptional regulator n=1 Tax=Dolosigranulum savutiense TaxID=3110288 RepID=A0AB74U042_9LACT
MNIRFNNRDPIYVQVVEYFKEELVAKRLQPGQEIPSRRQLARELKINPNTVQRAYKEMEEMQLIYTEANIASKITEDLAVLRQLRQEWAREAVKQFVQQVSLLELDEVEVIQMIQDEWKKEDSDVRG